jgi:hypothetical protein
MTKCSLKLGQGQHKSMDHEVLDFPRMIPKLEGMNMYQENPKVGLEKEKP